MSIATDGSKSWASRRMLRYCFKVPFVQWKLARVTFIVPEKNRESLELVDRLGAVEEGRVRALFADDDAGVVFGMLRRDCKWID